MSCCNRNPGPPLRPDEGPSDEDVARFGGETVPCKFCGAEIYDEAEWCHKCGKALGGSDEPVAGPPVWLVVTGVAVVGALLLLALRLV